MRLYKPKYHGKHGEVCTVSKWCVEFYDHNRRLRRISAFADRKASEELGRNIDRLVACRISGVELDPALSRWVENLPEHYRNKLAAMSLLDARHAAVSKPLEAHLKDYRASLDSSGRVGDYVSTTVSRVRTIIKACRFNCWSDISPDKVHRFLAELRDNGKGASIETSNQYLRALKQFANWMVRNGRGAQSPVAYIKCLNSDLDRRRTRKALTPDECRRLIQATVRGPIRFSMSGPERALLYRVALETGLRASELRSLTKSSFDFDHNPPVVTVRAVDSKHKREDVLPLRPGLASELRIHLAMKQPMNRVFNAPLSPKSCWRTCSMLKADLEAAGIPYMDASGRATDFHSLRHTFITNLAISGVHPKIAQTLARHSSIELTMNRYTHVAIGSLVSALSQLPDITDGKQILAQPVALTGTNGASDL